MNAADEDSWSSFFSSFIILIVVHHQGEESECWGENFQFKMWFKASQSLVCLCASKKFITESTAAATKSSASADTQRSWASQRGANLQIHFPWVFCFYLTCRKKTTHSQSSRVNEMKKAWRSEWAQEKKLKYVFKFIYTLSRKEREKNAEWTLALLTLLETGLRELEENTEQIEWVDENVSERALYTLCVFGGLLKNANSNLLPTEWTIKFMGSWLSFSLLFFRCGARVESRICICWMEKFVCIFVVWQLG